MSKVDQEEDYDQLRAEVGGQTTRKVLDLLQNQDFVGSISTRLNKAPQTVGYHIEKLQERNLVEETRCVEDRTYYKITEKGKVVLDGLNVPDY
ncbi:MAG: hypothetical protein ABEK00_00570 [Candidatus Nanohaloarchaea archaeon]